MDCLKDALFFVRDAATCIQLYVFSWLNFQCLGMPEAQKTLFKA